MVKFGSKFTSHHRRTLSQNSAKMPYFSRNRGILWVLRGNSDRGSQRTAADASTSQTILADLVRQVSSTGENDDIDPSQSQRQCPVHNRCEVKASIEVNLIRSVRCATEDEMSKLDEASRSCSICLDEMNATDSVITSCGHIFHGKCFEQSER